MKNILLLIGLLVMNLTVSWAQGIDQIAAVVNDEVITNSELSEAYTTVRAQFRQEQVNLPPEKELKHQVLDQLINKRLQLQLANQAKLKITEKELDEGIERIAKQNGMPLTVFYQRISDEGISKKTYRKEMQEQLLLQKLQQHEVASRLVVTQPEIDSYLHSRIWQTTSTPKEFHLIDILLPLSDSPTPTELQNAKKEALKVADALSHGTSLEKVARPLLNTQFALQSEDLGFLSLSDIPSAFVKEVSHRHKNEIAGPIQTGNGFHILEIADTRSSANSQTMPSRKEVENLLLQRKFSEAIQNWISKLRSQAYIVINNESKHA